MLLKLSLKKIPCCPEVITFGWEKVFYLIQVLFSQPIQILHSTVLLSCFLMGSSFIKKEPLKQKKSGPIALGFLICMNNAKPFYQLCWVSKWALALEFRTRSLCRCLFQQLLLHTHINLVKSSDSEHQQDRNRHFSNYMFMEYLWSELWSVPSED